MKFRIYYSDGSIVDGNGREDWNNSPHNGIQAVCYWYTDAGPTCAWGNDDYDFPESDVVKEGELIDWDDHIAVIERVRRDTGTAT